MSLAAQRQYALPVIGKDRSRKAASRGVALRNGRSQCGHRRLDALQTNLRRGGAGVARLVERPSEYAQDDLAWFAPRESGEIQRYRPAALIDKRQREGLRRLRI